MILSALSLILGIVILRKILRWKREEERRAERLDLAAGKYFGGGD